MTLEQHIENADDLAIAFHHLEQVFFRCQKHYGKSNQLMRALLKVFPSSLQSQFTIVKAMLDSEFHRLISDDQFGVHGNIYYNQQKRYEDMMNDVPIPDGSRETMGREEAVKLLNEAAWRIESLRPNENGKGGWCCGGAYWRLANILKRFLEPNLEQQEGVEHAKFIINTHGRIVK